MLHSNEAYLPNMFPKLKAPNPSPPPNWALACPLLRAKLDPTFPVGWPVLWSPILIPVPTTGATGNPNAPLPLVSNCPPTLNVGLTTLSFPTWTLAVTAGRNAPVLGSTFNATFGATDKSVSPLKTLNAMNPRGRADPMTAAWVPKLPWFWRAGAWGKKRLKLLTSEMSKNKENCLKPYEASSYSNYVNLFVGHTHTHFLIIMGIFSLYE